MRSRHLQLLVIVVTLAIGACGRSYDTLAAEGLPGPDAVADSESRANPVPPSSSATATDPNLGFGEVFPLVSGGGPLGGGGYTSDCDVEKDPYAVCL